MPRPHPHPLAVFSLKPTNQRAYDVLNHPNNEYLVSKLEGGELALDIGHVSSVSGVLTTLATLGRDADITIPGASISKVHCSFEIDNATNVVMFYDRSHNQSCQVYGEVATPFEYGRPRKVVVNDEINTIIGIGGEKRNLISFELKWHCEPRCVMEKVKNRQHGTLEQNYRLARTIDERDTSAPTQMETRLHTAGGQQHQLRYHLLNETLGYGEFGSVDKVVDIDTGRVIARKSLKRPIGEVQRTKLATVVKSEVENLSRLDHPHIVDYISFICEDDHTFHIFTGLKDGTLESLMETVGSSDINCQIADSVLIQMLQATDFLATKDIVHRDIKPQNILYTKQSDDYCFQLSDFGLSNSPIMTNTISGSPIYMAPEIMQGGVQTHKVDVWSLFVTMLWTLDVTGFRQQSRECQSHEDIRSMILSRVPAVPQLEEMARMLVKLFNGDGLSTPLLQVPALSTLLLQVTAPDSQQACTSAQTMPTLTRKLSNQLRRRGLWRRVIPQDPFRVGKGLRINNRTKMIDHPAITRKRVGPANSMRRRFT
ncbi:kinase-like domain-containing protein [Xylaria digitata]|nr:kinase-like domain-containing protein [Xylaria digitata]